MGRSHRSSRSSLLHFPWLFPYLPHLSPLPRENLEASAEERDVIMQYSFTVSLNALKVYPANYVTECKFFIKPQVLVDNFRTELECLS